MEILHHVTHNRIDCGLREKPAKRCNKCLPSQTMVNYAQVTLLNWFVCVFRLLIVRAIRVNYEF